MSRSRLWNPAWAIMALGAALTIQSASCASDNDVGESNTPDGGAGAGSDERCDGIDNNGDGRIDEGCPCVPDEQQACYRGTVSTRGVGICADGAIACEGTGEYGTWSGQCTGGTLPGVETCNGLDDNCDGTVDEGCACTNPGETRACGAPGLPLPCKQGTQTCSGGVWTACVGAVAPQDEICGNDIDDNCDGHVDEQCGCVPTVEICGDGVDNDCDGKIDESGCITASDGGTGGSAGAGGTAGAGGSGGTVGDGGAGGTGGTLNPPEDCSTPVVADFRDRVLWHTAIPGAGRSMANIGGHQIARLAGQAESLVAVDLHSLFGSPYTFGGTSTTDDQLGYLAFADGAETAQHAWPGPARVFDTSGDHLGVSGLFLGTVDIGLGSWTSDPTLYSSTPQPVAIADLYAASAAVPAGAVSGGTHFTITGVPADPLPGSFAPILDPFAASVDPQGNVYVTGRFQGTIKLGASSVVSSDPVSSSDWGAFVVSFSKTGALRWLDAVQHATGREMVIDPSGHYLALIEDQLPGSVMLELRDASNGAVTFHLQGSQPSGLELLAVNVDTTGNVSVLGQSQSTAFTLGSLQVAAKQDYVASFDKQGALRWSHELLASQWPEYQSVRYQIVSNGSEIAMMLGVKHVTSTDPALINIGPCARAIPRRAYPRDPETGRTVPWDQRPASYWDVSDLFLAVLDAQTGDHRWSRLVDEVSSSTSNASIAIHSSGDVIVALHNATSNAQVDYGDGLQTNATHVFRLHGL